ncbi:membrane-associated, eicosanoid/glutathione metabolism protein [Hypoxylon cercidicola]|nr:membrane-associated, eicosanoid/glutathione metabolism protein [Hypoxylon cercidicola]
MSSQPLGSIRLPVTGAFALPFAGYFVYLSLRVSLARIVHRVALGDTVGVAAKTPSSAAASSPSYDSLQLATRAHQNFAENVPLALVLAATAELNGATPERLATILAMLLALRVLHAEFGLSRPDALGIGRPVGYYGTMAIVVWLASWSAWLVYRG